MKNPNIQKGIYELIRAYFVIKRIKKTDVKAGA
jgi:hypothetical protein